MMWAALARYSVPEADTVCHVPDGADGGVEVAGGRVLPRCQRRIVSPPGGAVDLLPQDVGVTGVPCGLLDHCVTIRLSETGWGRPGLAMVATVDRSGQPPADLVAAGTRLPAGGDTWSRVAPGAGHGHVDVVVLADEDPLEPVLLDPGQVPDEAEQAGPGRQTGVRCCSAVSPADARTTASRTLARKYNSTSRSDSATSRPALSLALMPPELRACLHRRPPANAGHRESGAAAAGQVP